MSLRQLLAAAQAKLRHDWDQQIFLAEVIVNSAPNFSKKRRPYISLAKCHPLRQRRGRRGRRPGSMPTEHPSTEIVMDAAATHVGPSDNGS